jgi:hypothetical protein
MSTSVCFTPASRPEHSDACYCGCMCTSEESDKLLALLVQLYRFLARFVHQALSYIL